MWYLPLRSIYTENQDELDHTGSYAIYDVVGAEMTIDDIITIKLIRTRMFSLVSFSRFFNYSSNNATFDDGRP
jgi:hypothetical protein